MEKVDKLKEIIDAYRRFEPRFKEYGIDLGEVAGNGFWTQTRWHDGAYFLEKSLDESLLKPGIICDAGSGDGRMSALFDIYGFNPIINIELDQRLVSISREIADDLRQRGILTSDMRTVQGDFTDSEAYKNAGLNFSDIRNFFMGINKEPLKRLAEKIKRESLPGTNLIVYGMFDRGDEPELPLNLVHRFRTPDLLADFLFYRN